MGKNIAQLASSVATAIRASDSGKLNAVTASLLTSKGNALNLVHGAFNARAWLAARDTLGKPVEPQVRANIQALVGHATTMAKALGELGPSKARGGHELGVSTSRGPAR